MTHDLLARASREVAFPSARRGRAPRGHRGAGTSAAAPRDGTRWRRNAWCSPRLSTAAPPVVALVAAVLVVALAGPGAAAAQATRYVVEPERSQITFHATSRFVDADGRFHRFEGEVLVDPRKPAGARVRLRVDAASIDTANSRRDVHLRNEDFFHAERYPDLVFESSSVEGSLPRLLVTGRLTARGVTREIRLPVEVEITGGSLTARGQVELKRTDYGISYQSFINPVGDIVRVAFVIRARTVGGGS